MEKKKAAPKPKPAEPPPAPILEELMAAGVYVDPDGIVRTYPTPRGVYP